MKPIELPSGALYIIDKLNAEGERADVVGGCVRDHIMCRPTGDYDITTSATPDRVAEILAGSRIVNTGIKHGTVTVVLDDGSYEVTTYRLDGEYLDNRHPSEVIFTDSLALDLERRDFTINAMCYNPRDGFTDLYGGVSDIEGRTIRAVGSPERRFTEDALRIMRALRFAAVLDFHLDGETEQAARDLKHLLANVSRERIYTEWQKLLSGLGAYRVLRDYGDILAAAIPELCNLRLPDERRFAEAGYLSRLLSLFCLSTDTPPESFLSAMLSLKTDNAIRALGDAVLKNYRVEPPLTERDALRLLAACDKAAALEVVKLGMLLGHYTADSWNVLGAVIEKGLPYRISDLAIDGNSLLALGARGKQIGDILSLLLGAVIDGKSENTEDELLLLAKSMLKE